MGQYLRVPIDIETRSETLRLARALKISPEMAVVLLIRFMTWGDQNADEDKQVQIDPESLDAVVRHKGFSSAAISGELIFDLGVDTAPSIKIRTDLVDEQTYAVRLQERERDTERKRKEREAEAERQRLEGERKQAKKKGASCPPDIRRTSAGLPTGRA